MKTEDFNYNLPKELIAQEPARPRDHSRLLVVDRKSKKVEQQHFYDLPDYLKKGDLIVCNNSKVFKARLLGQLLSITGQSLLEHKKKIEIFLVRPTENFGVWQVLGKPSKHLRAGTKVVFAKDFFCEVMVKKPDGTLLVQFDQDEETVRCLANKYGQVPVPPYIKKEPSELAIYQTIYAKPEGSVAAPTAGFHFTPQLMERLRAKGVEFAELTLHVGLGTFLPVKVEQLEEHKMHSEQAELTQENADKINQAKSEGRRIIAVGTTTVRTLEGLASLAGYADKKFESFKGEIDIFIKPGFKFQVVDALITNFHLPKSTLLMLVCAFVGDREFTLNCYNQAVKEKYRFYSFGDSMFIY